jgi:hypothetical protein
MIIGRFADLAKLLKKTRVLKRQDRLKAKKQQRQTSFGCQGWR